MKTSFLLTVVSLLLVGLSCLGDASDLAVWLYEFPQRDNEQLIDDLTEMGINQVLVSIDSRQFPGGDRYSESYTKKVRDFVTSAKTASIAVHAMTLEDPVFTYPRYHSQGRELVQFILQYCRTYPEASFAGVHIDVEPHVLPQWSDGDWAVRERLMKSYSRLLGKLRRTINRGGVALEFSAAITWWFNEKAQEGLLPSGDATKLGQYLDSLVPMVYGGIGGSAEDITWRVEDELAESRTLVGVGATEYADYSALTTAIQQLDAHFSPNANYLGVCIFDYDALRTMFQARVPALLR